MDARVQHVVVDSGAFIRNAPLRDIGVNVYSLHDVVQEILDKATRQRLQVLPYDLHMKNPSPEAIKQVTDFSKKTGDYRSLSSVDIKVIALVYDLEAKHVGKGHIKTSPDKKVQWSAVRGPLERPTEIVGFYLEKKKPDSSRTVSECSSLPSEAPIDHTSSRLDSLAINDESLPEKTSENSPQTTGTSRSSTEHLPVNKDDVETDKSISPSETDNQLEKSIDPETQTEENGDIVGIGNHCRLQEGAVLESNLILDENDENSSDEYDEGFDDEDEDDDDDDDDDGWITPQNLRAAKQAMGDCNTERATVPVACVTTDFAMQNVLIQMGLNVVSVDGMLIHRAKSYVLRCRACFKVTTIMDKQFCPHCGNQTLEKISMTTADDGSVVYHLSRKKPTTRRGQRFSLPTPKGGKHANNPILFEDQKEAQQRASKASRNKMDVFSPDYVAQNSPFSVNDVHSRAAQLGISGKKSNRFGAKRNPNENKKVYGRRK